jgi:hypothetical protein
MTPGARWLIILFLVLVLITLWSGFRNRLRQASWKQRIAEFKHLLLIAIAIYFCISLIFTLRNYWPAQP